MSSESPAAIPAPPPERDDDSVTVASLPLTGSKEKELEDGAVKEGAGEEEVTFPEGGFQAWTQVFGSFLVLFTTFGYANAFGVYQSYYKANQFSNIAASNISWLGSIQVWLQFSVGILSGPLFDKGYFRVLLAAGSVIHVFSLFMVSLCKTYWQAILAQAIGMGLGMGLLMVPAMSILSHYFRRRRSLAMGFSTVGGSVGGICFPIMLNRLFVSVAFESAVRATAFLNLGCLVIANAILRPRLPCRKSHIPAPSAISMFSEARYAIACAGAFFIAMGIFFPFFYLQIFCELNGISQTLSFASLAILNGASVPGRIIPNALADRFGVFNLLVPSSAVASVMIFAMLGATTPGGVIAFAVLFGFFSGSYVSLIGPAIATLARNHTEIGQRIGLAFVVVGCGALGGSPIAGALLARTGNAFYAPICFAGVSTMIGTGLMGVARWLQAKEKGTQWI